MPCWALLGWCFTKRRYQGGIWGRSQWGEVRQVVSPPFPFPPLFLSIPPKFSDKPVGGKVSSSEGKFPGSPPLQIPPYRRYIKCMHLNLYVSISKAMSRCTCWRATKWGMYMNRKESRWLASPNIDCRRRLAGYNEKWTVKLNGKSKRQ